MGAYNYVSLQTRISAEIADSTNASVSLAMVKRAIISAIEFYERERTWFNESVTTALVTVASFPAIAVPSDLLLIDKIQVATTTTFTGDTTAGTSTITTCSSTSGLSAGQIITGAGIPASTFVKSVDSATQVTMGDIFGTAVNATATAATITVTAFASNRVSLDPITYSEWVDQSSGASGASQPAQYAYNEDRILLYPTPNAVYGLILSYVKRLATLAADTDANGWTNFCEPLIRSRSKWDIFEHVLYFPELAKPCKQEEIETLLMLDSEKTQRMTTGRTRAVYL